MPVTTNTAGNEFLTRVYNVDSPEECRKLYDEWATTFDKDLTDPSQDYVAPTFVLQAVLSAIGSFSDQTTVLDAGCGTGLSGIPLSQAGAKNIEGMDISPGMLKIAERTGVYTKLETADLSRPIEKEDESFDVITCVGTLTHGHVGPDPALKEFVRIVKKRGVIAATVLDDIWEEGGFKAEVAKLKDAGKVEVISTDKMDYRKGAGVLARLLVLRKI